MVKFIKEEYKKIDVIEKQKLIKIMKDTFGKELGDKLNLLRVSAPLFLDKDSGLSDDLSGVERKVDFDLLSIPNKTFEVCQSLAKWKRYALYKYGFKLHTGLYTDMEAIRRDETLDELHSAFVDQYDWEKVISREDRTIDYLKNTVKEIVKAIIETSSYIKSLSSITLPTLSENVHFISSEDLLKLYPTLSPKEREYEIVKKYKTVFIMQIGGRLSNGLCHDLRAPDYDDWSLNGDLLFYHKVLDCALEISSMGIRVDENSLRLQCEEAKTIDRLTKFYHKKVLDKTFPLTIGGGIGQSRLSMLILGRANIGEVQASSWSDKIIDECKQYGIDLL
jgi:aspartate--ammonia ligase